MTPPRPRSDGRSETLIRAPNHLGDVIMALPAIVTDGSDVLVVRGLAPILEMAHLNGRVLPFDRGLRGFTHAVRELRGQRYTRGLLMTPSFSAAWLMRCGGVRRLRGTVTDRRSFMLTEGVDVGALRGRHRIDAFRLLLGQEGAVSAAPRLSPPQRTLDRWRAELRPGGERGPLVGLIPGSKASARRWPADRFANVGNAVIREASVIVLGGSAERALTARVANDVPGAVDLGGRTDLYDLAALLSLCELVVTNDTGPMHLAGAVGTRTVSLWGSSSPAEVCQVGARDVRVEGPMLPCRPCRGIHCDRRGAGTVLPDARDECMRLIDTDLVTDAVRSALADPGSGSLGRPSF